MWPLCRRRRFAWPRRAWASRGCRGGVRGGRRAVGGMGGRAAPGGVVVGGGARPPGGGGGVGAVRGARGGTFPPYSASQARQKAQCFLEQKRLPLFGM